MKLQNLLTLPNILWGTKEETLMNEILNSSITQVPQGQFSYAVEKDQKVYLVRDRLGLNKLFYHIDYEKKGEDCLRLNLVNHEKANEYAKSCSKVRARAYWVEWHSI